MLTGDREERICREDKRKVKGLKKAKKRPEAVEATGLV